MITSWVIIFTEFHEDWTKIVDLLLVAYFWTWAFFMFQTFQMRPSKNADKWKAILWSKIGVLWAPINYLKSAGTHFFEKI